MTRQKMWMTVVLDRQLVDRARRVLKASHT